MHDQGMSIYSDKLLLRMSYTTRIAMFASPNAFQPERFLESSDPRLKTFDLPFGFGRRICPGMHLARNSLFIVISRLLWSFDILPALSDDGKEVIPGLNLPLWLPKRLNRFPCFQIRGTTQMHS